MKVLKRLAQVLLILLGVGFLTGVFTYQFLKPDYNGVKSLPGLSSEVEVYFDTFGIPHIYGKKDEDAFKALGYVHAQDRLWQMELLRRVARGGLSEVFGRELLNTDKFFLALGISDASSETVAALNMQSPEVILSQAYLDGVNEFIESGPTPVEFYLTGIEKTAFTLEDIHNTIAYMAFSFAMAHKTDPLLSTIKDSLGIAYLADLQVGYDSLATRIRNYTPASRDSVAPDLVSAVTAALKDLPIPQFIGSNSWVLAPGKTSTGHVILANDPHIGYAQPSVWYEAHLSTPTYEKYGYHMAGIPFPLLAHNHQMAYGLTMFENDDLDFYYEQNHPSDTTVYKSGDDWMKYEYQTRPIKVKEGREVLFTYKKTIRGPVMNGIAEQLTGKRPVSMSWIYTKVQNQLLRVFYEFGNANGLEEFRKALPKLHAPGLNVMYGDSSGNIGWWATARLYRMPDSVNTKFILDGSNGREMPLEFLPFTENPKAINPPWDYVYSANNQPEPMGERPYPGYYLPENRARRIVEILESKNNWDRKSVSAMILDDTSPVDLNMVTDLVKAIDITQLNDQQIKILDLLNQWEGNYLLKSVEPTIFHRWVYFLLKNTFEDELGPARFNQLLGTHFLKRLTAPLIASKGSVWFDNVRTADTTESKEEIIQDAFNMAVGSLREQLGKDMEHWTWDRIHTLEHGHPIGRVSYLRSFFNVGPFPVRGSREVINNMSFSYSESGDNKVTSGPSTRRIIDFSDVENSVSILPTGQSGNPFSPHYNDQAELFVNGKFRPMLLNKDRIEASSVNLLIFKSK